MLKIISCSKKFDFNYPVVITPLKTNDKISKLTKNTIKRNDFPFLWVSYESDNNRPTNIELSLNELYSTYNQYPKYFIPIDNNIELGRHFIDRLYESIIKSSEEIGYVYGNLEYKGEVSHKFPAVSFNLGKLLESNYISSNSMFKTDYVLEVELPKDESMKRLLDWALLIKLARYGYYGLNCTSANHIAHTTSENISSYGEADYKKKYIEVYTNFIKPFIEELKLQREINNKNKGTNALNDKENLSLI